MKLISLDFRCFGAFPGEVHIDFEDAGRDGLFLICGDTGAGKTTILDAVCFALYYATSGASRKDKDNGKGDFEQMRSRYAYSDKSIETYVMLVLEKDGERFRFSRFLTPKKRVEGFDERSAYDRWNGSAWEPVLANPKQLSVTKEAEKLIGLDADQFRQIIILPQGRFERLLTSDSAAKEEILSTLFGADHWAGAVRRMKDCANARKNMLDRDRADIVSMLKLLQCESTQALSERIDAMQRDIPVLEEYEKQAETAFLKADAAEKEAGPVEQLFQNLDRRAFEVKRLEQAAPEMERRRQTLTAAVKAEQLRGDLTELKRIRREAAESGKVVSGKKTELEAKRAGLDSAKQKWNEHDSKRGEQERAKELRLRLEAAGVVYAEYDALLSAEEKLKAAADTAARLLAKRQTEKTAAAQKLVTAEAERERFNHAYDETSRLYVLGAAGRLAQRLEEGVPCPVCGSVCHPKPAQSEARTVTDQELKNAEEQRDLYQKRFTLAYEADKKAAEAVTEASEKRNAAVSQYNTNHELLISKGRERIEGIADERQLEKRIRELKARIDLFDQDEKTVRAALEAAGSACGAAEGAYTEARKIFAARTEALSAAETLWTKRLAENGYADEASYAACLMEPDRLEALRSAIQRFESDLAHAREEYRDSQAKTEGRQRPDMTALKAAAGEASQKLQEAKNTLRDAGNALRLMNTKLGELQKREAAIRIAETEYLRLKEFVDRIDNSTGMNLHRYLLSAMLSLVIDQANRLLLNVHNGRYQLVRSEESHGNAHKTGLEFNVEDTGTSSIRSVNTLSGGEKFLVSLALAIGLNAVLRAQVRGVRVDAIFVDEGFGSLDADSVNDAMYMLNIVRDSRNLVGVISHIDALRNEIPVHVEVHKDTAHGSTLTVG